VLQNFSDDPYIEKANKRTVTLSLAEPKAKELVALILKERQDLETFAIAKKKLQQDATLAKEKEREDAALAKKKDRQEKNTVAQNGEKGVVNRANYQRIIEGMTRREVENLVGPGKEVLSAGNLTTVNYQTGIFNVTLITISYMDDRVAAKLIVD
jgi:hypothetical protein